MYETNSKSAANEIRPASLTIEQTNKIHNIIDVITDKLSYVLRPSLPQEMKNVGAETELESNLQSIIDKLTDIQDRIKL